MPTKDQHINQWKRNRTLLLTNAFSEFPEWKVTVAFYCALHAVEALLSFQNLPKFKDHKGRNEFLAQPANKMLAIWRPYKALFDASHDARYACPNIHVRFGPGVQKDLIQACLQTIESEVVKTLQLQRDEIPLVDVDSSSGDVILRVAAFPPADPSI